MLKASRAMKAFLVAMSSIVLTVAARPQLEPNASADAPRG
jgi:hypothetical protein